MIQTPLCPLCSTPPMFILADGHQCFCGSDDCPTLVWDSHDSLEWNLTHVASVDLPEPSDDGKRAR
jgi:hypothetical protein